MPEAIQPGQPRCRTTFLFGAPNQVVRPSRSTASRVTSDAAPLHQHGATIQILKPGSVSPRSMRPHFCKRPVMAA